MRPVRKGIAYLYVDGQPYRKAKDGLIARLGLYCSYCERRLATGHEVEHIQAKDPSAFPTLAKVWTNFLISCKNCNTSKSKKNVPLSDWLIPDRDNTFRPFEYLPDGTVNAVPGVSQALAKKTISIVNLNRKVKPTTNDAGLIVAIDKRSQRMQAFLLAERYRKKWNANPTQDLEDSICELAKSYGFFSIWLHAFVAVPEIWNRLITEFPGTVGSCFDIMNTSIGLPHHNPDALTDGSKC